MVVLAMKPLCSTLFRDIFLHLPQPSFPFPLTKTSFLPPPPFSICSAKLATSFAFSPLLLLLWAQAVSSPPHPPGSNLIDSGKRQEEGGGGGGQEETRRGSPIFIYLWAAGLLTSLCLFVGLCLRAKKGQVLH